MVYYVCLISQGDPLQLFSLCEVLKSDGTGPEAKLTVKVIDSYWDKPMNFLPQGGGPAEGEEMEVLRKDLLPANPASQDQTPDLADLDKCAANLPVTNVGYRQPLLSTACCACLDLAASTRARCFTRWGCATAAATSLPPE